MEGNCRQKLADILKHLCERIHAIAPDGVVSVGSTAHPYGCPRTTNLFCFAITSSAVIQLLALTSGLLPVLRRAGTAARTVAETSRLTAAVSFPEELLHFGRSTLHATETSQE